MYDVTIIVPSKGWLHYLKQTVSHLSCLESFVKYRVLVVDYGCPDSTFEWIKEQNLPNIHCIKVKDDIEKFNLSRCRNIGIKHANSKFVAFLDGDVIPPKNYINKALTFMAAKDCNYVSYASNSEKAKHLEYGTYTLEPLCDYGFRDSTICPEDWKYWIISSILSKDACDKILGFDEGFKNWSFEDVDFRKRLNMSGCKDYWIGGEFTHFHTTIEESSRFFDKNRDESRKENLARTLDNSRDINKHGYGVTENHEIFEGEKC